jgi:recA bacterial DNA recombination protein
MGRKLTSAGKKKAKSDGVDSGNETLSRKDLALHEAIDQIQASFGKGAIMWLGRSQGPREVPVISTGSFSLDMALGVGGLPKVMLSQLKAYVCPSISISFFCHEMTRSLLTETK